ncbi:glycosyltransferase family 2 protein [Mesonia mobilis]|uniref:Glycosyltransferase 2-like domain-containing protein n=1 Tax=Mesonia mobilis TaxID=369791 RepID=A0ABQ3BQ32_9FLAO|nr:glycosyltransferase family A protein [Mesonia mobilis]MBQ0738146.1 glycosyltransferase family 2 protein [Aquimarina celericrescens]GGZ53414.1 hypothetical protein GCM10008088_13870 [Mesonia mobilis]
MDIAKIFEQRFQLEKEYLGIDKAVHSIEPVVSVCVAAYQHVNYIEECLEGILMQQTTFPIEIIIGEDGSSDGTREKCMAYAEEHPDKIRLYLRNRESSQLLDEEGTYITRFNGKWNRRAARGRYIAMCEGDDYWTDPLKLQKQVDFLEANSDYVLSFHPCDFLKYGNFIRQEFSKIDYEYHIYNLLTKWNIPTASMVFKNFKTQKYPNWYFESASGDIAISMLLFEKGKFKLLQDYMSIYRVEGQGVSVFHKGYRMIHYRAKFYSNLNEYFDYKYEKEIYDALAFIYNKFSKAQQPKKTLTLEEVSIKTHLQLVLKKLKQKLL